jgi:SAM-dependent methyltransferase
MFRPTPPPIIWHSADPIRHASKPPGTPWKALMPASPYLTPGFYDDALARGRHRDIVGGRWDETGRVQMAILKAAGLQPHHHLLDIGCGSLRLGHMAVPFLDPGHYWGTDASLALMQRGYAVELADKTRLPLTNLVEDADFALPGIPDSITHAIAFGVFTHLPAEMLAPALISIRARLPNLTTLLLTVFTAPDGHHGAHRQPDGVVTHPDRPPYHRPMAAVEADARAAGFVPRWPDALLPRGQRLCRLSPLPQTFPAS